LVPVYKSLRMLLLLSPLLSATCCLFDVVAEPNVRGAPVVVVDVGLILAFEKMGRGMVYLHCI
jgi:hypothetical protein